MSPLKKAFSERLLDHFKHLIEAKRVTAREMGTLALFWHTDRQQSSSRSRTEEEGSMDIRIHCPYVPHNGLLSPSGVREVANLSIIFIIHRQSCVSLC